MKYYIQIISILAFLYSPTTFCNTRNITIHNAISKKMLRYKYFISYAPSTFILKVNGKDIPLGKKETVPVTNNTLEVSYNYSFLKGLRKGNHKIVYNVKPEVKECSLTFSWYTKFHIDIDHAKPVDITINKIA